MLEMAREIETLRRELKLLRLQQAAGSCAPAGGDAAAPAEERPPHY